jgi:hypothetical protein
MKISRTHKALSDKLKNPEVLTNLEPFLGPNWETVLRWWLYYESLTVEQQKELDRRYWAIDRDARDRAWYLANSTAAEFIGEDKKWAVWWVSPFLSTTYELISMHLLFERGHSLTFVPLVNNL